jgi:hypothetical protein
VTHQSLASIRHRRIGTLARGHFGRIAQFDGDDSGTTRGQTAQKTICDSAVWLVQKPARGPTAAHEKGKTGARLGVAAASGITSRATSPKSV